MLEGLKGDAGEVTRLAAHANLDAKASLQEPPADSMRVRRVDAPAALDAVAADGSRVRQLPTRPIRADSGGVRQRLQAAYQQRRPDGRPWTARTLAAAAGCGRSSAASFLQTQPVAEQQAGS
jgi:hypothetical protein